MGLNNELETFLLKNIIERCTHEDGEWISSLFVVPKPNGKVRVIINLKELNKIVKYDHFKMAAFRSALELVFPNCFMASIDLSDAYYSFSVRQCDRKFLRFFWNDQLYQFAGMPMGLSCSPRIFTKILLPLFTDLRRDGHICLAYLDDSFIVGETKEDCFQSVKVLAERLQKLGFFINVEKSVLEPSTSAVFLGYEINSVSMQVSLTDKKREKFIRAANDILSQPACSIRELAGMVGLMTAYSTAVEYGEAHSKLIEFDRNEALKVSRGNFDKFMTISDSGCQDINWWLNNLNRPKPIRFYSPSQEIYTDASNQGWGAVSDSVQTGQRWNFDELLLHINVLELKAVLYGLQSLWDGHSEYIKIHCDNTTAIAYVTKKGGVRSPQCNEVASQIWQFCEDNNLMLVIVHIPGVDNIVADKRSRHFSDSLELELNSSIFDKICHEFGTPEVDLFATRINTKCDNYYSWKPDPGAVGFDSFTIPWNDGKLYYAFPPFCQVGRVVNKVLLEGGNLILVAPAWASQVWFPLLLRLAKRKIRFRKRGSNLTSRVPSSLPLSVPLVACLF